VTTPRAAVTYGPEWIAEGRRLEAEAARAKALPLADGPESVVAVNVAGEATAVSASGRWSPYQRAVFDAVANPAGGNIVVEALAGSGKTTTIIEALSHTSEDQSALLCAFNKAIANELKPKAPEGVDVMTLHAYGLRAVSRSLGRKEIDSGLVMGHAKRRIGMGRDKAEDRKAVCKLVSACKATLAFDPEAIDATADAMGIDLDPERRDHLIGVTEAILAACADDGPIIDFDDMIWLPIVKELEVPAFDWVFVDETQDLSPAQLALVRAAAGTDGRIVAVGDRRQAIYAFRGADSEAIPRMIRELSATVLPLSICYRCPALVVAEARRIVPNIEAAPNAPDGVVRSANPDTLRAEARPGDFVVSRLNAPLVSLAFKWLAAGRRCSIRGRDIGAGLVAWVRSTNAVTIPELLGEVAIWQAREIERLEALDRDPSAVIDRAECLRAICEGAADPTAVIARLERLFSDDDPAGAIILTSTHRAKGLEADRVWLLRDTYLQRRKRRKGAAESWEAWNADPWSPIPTEEHNLLYVAITRSKRELIYVREGAP
jgi:superfamily I DNA/RNA helicase